MAARIVETDFGSKPATRKKMKEMQDMVPSKWEKMMNRYWYKVYENTIQAITDMGAVDTGALRQSIRIEKNKTIAPGISGGNYEVVRGTDQSAYIVAGGGGVENPRHKREVDYAQAVHDGYFETKIKKRAVISFNKRRQKAGLTKTRPEQYEELGFGSGWRAGRPFLDEGLQRTEGYLDELMKQYMDDKENVWKNDQPMPTTYFLPLRMFPSKYG